MPPPEKCIGQLVVLAAVVGFAEILYVDALWVRGSAEFLKSTSCKIQDGGQLENFSTFESL